MINLKREINIIAKLNHPSVLKFIGYNPIDFNHKPNPIIITEYSSNGSLKSIIQLERQSLSPSEWNDTKKLINIFAIASAMAYLHSKNILHRDLKPENILEDDHLFPKIADFSISQTKGIGTLLFMAPELLEEESETNYTNKVDVYSFGITLIYIITDKYPPFSMKRAASGILPKLPENISKWVREMINSCLSLEAENRPTFAEIFEMMKENNYDLFSDSKDQKLTQEQRKMKEVIERRITKIEAFEFQHESDFK